MARYGAPPRLGGAAMLLHLGPTKEHMTEQQDYDSDDNGDNGDDNHESNIRVTYQLIIKLQDPFIDHEDD